MEMNQLFLAFSGFFFFSMPETQFVDKEDEEDLPDLKKGEGNVVHTVTAPYHT